MTARDTYPVTDCDNCGEATSYESLEAHKLRAAGESFDDITITEGSYVPVLKDRTEMWSCAMIAH
jgi:hypothetical protein